MSRQTDTRVSGQLRGTLGAKRGEWRGRLLLHHVPLALASAVLLVLFMGFSPFTNSDARGDISSGTFPKAENQAMGHGGSQAQPMDMNNMTNMPNGPGVGKATRTFLEQSTMATGYLAVVLLGLTLIIGAANLLFRRRNPVSSYLRRDMGMWVAAASIAHVIIGVRSMGITFLLFFINDGKPRTNSFGWGNWTGLAALVIVVGLLTISTDRSLRELKAKRWKNLQRLNYALFVLVVLHAFFYGALLRTTSPFTLTLIVTVVAVFVGQVVGIWLWRRRHSRPADPRIRLDEEVANPVDIRR
jgi:sulfoxide reductase heme-binding subunit YedZ